MRTPPPEVVASWPAPNFDNPETRGPANQIISITLLVVATAFLVLRIYTRKLITYSFGWDDVFIIIAYLPAAAFIVAGIIAEQRFGWGLHIWDVRPHQHEWGLKLALSGHILFAFATNFTKLSMLTLIINLITTSNKVLRSIIYALMALISINCFVFLIKTLLQCRPIHHYWTVDIDPEEDSCGDESRHLLIAGIVNTITDFVVVSVPLVIVRRLYKESQLTSRQFIIVSLLFALGYLAAAAGAGRTYFTWIMLTHPDHDTTWRAWTAWMASSVELFSGLIAATVPATKPFFARYVPRLLEPAASRLSTRPRSRPAKKSLSVDMSPTTAQDVEKGYGTPGPINPSQALQSGITLPVATVSIAGFQGQTREVSRFSTSTTMSSPMCETAPARRETRASLSTVQEAEEGSRFSTSTIDSARSTAPLMDEPRKARLPDLNKPLPRIKTQEASSLYTISIILDRFGEESTPGRAPNRRVTEGGQEERGDVAIRDLTSRNSSPGG